MMVNISTFPVNSVIIQSPNTGQGQTLSTSNGQGVFHEDNERAHASNDSFVWAVSQEPRSDEALHTKDFAQSPARETSKSSRAPHQGSDSVNREDVGGKRRGFSIVRDQPETFNRTTAERPTDPDAITQASHYTTSPQKNSTNNSEIRVSQGPLGVRSSDPSTSQVIKDLKKATVRSRHFHTKFVPDSEVTRIITKDVVRNEYLKPSRSIAKLWKRPRGQAMPMQDVHFESYRKIFAILCLMKRTSKLRNFIHAAVCDNDLPLALDKNFELRSRRKTEGNKIRLPRNEDAEDFFDRQWSVLSPFFGSMDTDLTPHSELDPETILPFLNRTDVEREGGSGWVFKADIHPSHHCLHRRMNARNTKSRNAFAIKILKSNDETAFTREVTILKKLGSKSHTHPHIIVLLATYTLNNSYHLIFPWAETDLFGYWQRSDLAPGDSFATWIMAQCKGLADGLNTIHKYSTLSGSSLFKYFGLYGSLDATRAQGPAITGTEDIEHAARTLFGRHGDLKPENIVWFPDSPNENGNGILKITDFGVTRFNTENLWDTTKTGRVPNSPSYRSPECDLDGRLTTACDVWALGCVYLQFVTWYFGGFNYVRQFGTRRLEKDHRHPMATDTFFTIYEEDGRKKAKVKTSVVQMIDELKQNQRCTEAFQRFLDMIAHDMLVVHDEDQVATTAESSREVLLQITSTLNIPGKPRRKSCGDVFRTLGSIQPRDDDQDWNVTRRSTFQPTSPLTPPQNGWFDQLAERPARWSAHLRFSPPP